MSMLELAEAIGALTATAREGRTQPADMAGGTITITNVGVFGVDAGTPILNPGEAAILAFGTVAPAPVGGHRRRRQRGDRAALGHHAGAELRPPPRRRRARQPLPRRRRGDPGRPLPRARLGLSGVSAEAAEPTGVVFPEVDGRRSTGATGRAIVADALRPVDPLGAAAAARETNWRSGYLTHFRRLVEAGLARPEDAVAIADAGLASVYDRMCWRDPDGRQVRLEAALGGVAGSPADLLTTETRRGGGEPEDGAHHPLPRPPSRRRRPAPPARHLGGRRRRRAEPARGGRCGARPPRVAAPRGAHRRRARRGRRDGPAALAAALGRHRGRRRPAPPRPVDPAARRHPRHAPAGCSSRPLPARRDLDPAGRRRPRRTTCPTATGWVCGLPGSLVVGNYVYADGATNVRVSTAVDALTETGAGGPPRHRDVVPRDPDRRLRRAR